MRQALRVRPRRSSRLPAVQGARRLEVRHRRFDQSRRILREDNAMPYRLTSAQRCVLADCVRTGLVGWLITCPVAGQRCRILQARATSVLGFGFSRFTTMAANHFGADYRPRRPGSTDTFPLSIAEA